VSWKLSGECLIWNDAVEKRSTYHPNEWGVEYPARVVSIADKPIRRSPSGGAAMPRSPFFRRKPAKRRFRPPPPFATHLAPFQGAIRSGRVPGVSLRSTPGYRLPILRIEETAKANGTVNAFDISMTMSLTIELAIRIRLDVVAITTSGHGLSFAR
jgi:hypothetical protein